MLSPLLLTTTLTRLQYNSGLQLKEPIYIYIYIHVLFKRVFLEKPKGNRDGKKINKNKKQNKDTREK